MQLHLGDGAAALGNVGKWCAQEGQTVHTDELSQLLPTTGEATAVIKREDRADGDEGDDSRTGETERIQS